MGEVARRWNGLVHASIRFKLFTALCVAVGLSPILSFIPWWYDHGLVHVGEPACVFYLTLPWLASSGSRSGPAFRGAAAAYAAILVGLTVFEFFHDSPRLAYPRNPSFAFHPCQWLTGALIPVAMAWLAVIMPGSALPTPSPADAAGDRGAST